MLASQKGNSPYTLVSQLVGLTVPCWTSKAEAGTCVARFEGNMTYSTCVIVCQDQPIHTKPPQPPTCKLKDPLPHPPLLGPRGHPVNGDNSLSKKLQVTRKC